ncbi:MAG: hypothetical protein AMS22_10115 [Thiotrichales bacterium SG8_50]|nr:MAG: hypothetical protein AMS22_10115 [Thiotrichales bacterium SG8_50]
MSQPGARRKENAPSADIRSGTNFAGQAGDQGLDARVIARLLVGNRGQPGRGMVDIFRRFGGGITGRPPAVGEIGALDILAEEEPAAPVP